MKCNDWISTATHLFIVMEHLAGGDLFDYLEVRQYHLSEEDVHRIFFQVTHAVDYLHRNGVCHRDLKVTLTIFIN